MARKGLASSKKQSKSLSAERFLTTFFLTLIQKALARLSQDGDTQRAMSQAAYDVKKMLQDETKKLIMLLTAPIFTNSILDSSRHKAEDVLKELYGFIDGYPKGSVGIARLLHVSSHEIGEAEDLWFSEAAKHSDDLIQEIRKEWLQEHSCSCCKTKVGEVHQAGCQFEECPFCHDLLSWCVCAYKHLKIRWGGRTAKEWRGLEKQHGDLFNPRQHARPLTTQEERQWAAIVLKKGCIPYGDEQCFQ